MDFLDEGKEGLGFDLLVLMGWGGADPRKFRVIKNSFQDGRR